MKKSLATLLALVMALTLALPVLAHGEILEEITILMPGEETDEYAAFINGPFAQKVEEDLKMKVNFRWLSWSDYWDQKQLWFAAKEKVDLYWDGLTNLPGIVNRKEAQPLDDLLKEYWPRRHYLFQFGQRYERIAEQGERRSVWYSVRLRSFFQHVPAGLRTAGSAGRRRHDDH